MIGYLVLALLSHGDHSVLAGGHGLLPQSQVAGDVPWVHARVVGRLQAALLAIALVEVTAAVRSWTVHTWHYVLAVRLLSYSNVLVSVFSGSEN